MDLFVKYGWGLPKEIFFNLEAIDVLENHLEFIEQEIDQRQDHLKRKWQEMEEKKGDPDLEYWEIISEGQYVTSRILRNSFLVSLFTVYESITGDIAEHIKKSVGKTLSIKDIRLGVVDSTKRYYDDVLGFQLSKRKEYLNQLKTLAKLRNFIVHENGCFDYCSEQKRDEMLAIGGIENQDGYVVLSRDFLSDAFGLIESELEDLMERYTAWKISQKSS